jgi:hypothetical protein
MPPEAERVAAPSQRMGGLLMGHFAAQCVRTGEDQGWSVPLPALSTARPEVLLGMRRQHYRAKIDCMSVVLPSGYLTILQAADALLPAMCGGAPDFPLVSQLRQKGEPVGDRQAKRQSYC